MQKFRKINVFKVLLVLSGLGLVLGLGGCIQSKAVASSDPSSSPVRASVQITENTLKVVNATFYEKFVLGDWRYKGAKSQAGEINAYIKIPAPLDMDAEVQKQYLQQIICPSSMHKSMWKEVKHTPLSIHIYTNKPKNSVYVHCQNPYLGNQLKA